MLSKKANKRRRIVRLTERLLFMAAGAALCLLGCLCLFVCGVL